MVFGWIVGLLGLAIVCFSTFKIIGVWSLGIFGGLLLVLLGTFIVNMFVE